MTYGIKADRKEKYDCIRRTPLFTETDYVSGGS